VAKLTSMDLAKESKNGGIRLNDFLNKLNDGTEFEMTNTLSGWLVLNDENILNDIQSVCESVAMNDSKPISDLMKSLKKRISIKTNTGVVTDFSLSQLEKTAEFGSNDRQNGYKIAEENEFSCAGLLDYVINKKTFSDIPYPSNLKQIWFDERYEILSYLKVTNRQYFESMFQIKFETDNQLINSTTSVVWKICSQLRDTIFRQNAHDPYQVLTNKDSDLQRISKRYLELVKDESGVRYNFDKVQPADIVISRFSFCEIEKLISNCKSTEDIKNKFKELISSEDYIPISLKKFIVSDSQLDTSIAKWKTFGVTDNDTQVNVKSMDINYQCKPKTTGGGISKQIHLNFKVNNGDCKVVLRNFNSSGKVFQFEVMGKDARGGKKSFGSLLKIITHSRSTLSDEIKKTFKDIECFINCMFESKQVVSFNPSEIVLSDDFIKHFMDIQVMPRSFECMKCTGETHLERMPMFHTSDSFSRWVNDTCMKSAKTGEYETNYVNVLEKLVVRYIGMKLELVMNTDLATSLISNCMSITDFSLPFYKVSE
jgi:hypothetical protein